MPPRRLALVFGCALAAGSLAGLGMVACGDPAGGAPGMIPSATPGTPSPGPSASPSVAPSAATPVLGIAGAGDLFREGRYEEADAAFRKVAAASDGGERAEALLGAAVAAIASGESEGALAPLRDALAAAPAGSDVRVEAAYALARTLTGLGRPDEAALSAGPAAAEPSDAPLAPYLAAEVAKAYSLAGDRAAAEDARKALLAPTSLPPGIAAELYREAAAEAKASGDFESYVVNLSKAISASPAPGDRLEIAEALATAGDPNAAGYLRAIVEQTPSSRLALVALDRLRALGAGSVDPALEGQVRYRQGDYGGARTVLESALAAGTATNAAVAAFYLGAVYEETGPATDAIAAYDRVSGDPAWVHRARYWAAYLMAAGGDLASASARYADLAANGPAGEFTDEAAYQAGSLLLRSGDVLGAVAAWDAAAASDARTLYWKARALDSLGRPAEAAAALNAAQAAGPYEFHGLEAARRVAGAGPLDVSYRERTLERAPDFAAITRWLAGLSPGAEPALDVALAREFLAVGERERAADLVGAAGKSADPWAVLAALRAATELRLTDVTATLATRLRTITGATLAEAPRELLRLAYPLDYVASLDAEARSADVDPLFLAGLIRTESFWDPTAVSVADARGLTQFIPETAFAMANSFGIGDFAIEDLFRPALSLRFGADYISSLVRRFGRADAALAAYNGGPGNAGRWLGAPGATGSMADFVAAVDFTETRRYVTFVLEAYAVYQLAWSESE